MKFRFTGKYATGATGVSALGVRFEGREPTEVTGDAAVRLARHPEFEVVADAPPKNKGGRPRKVAD